MKRFLVFILVTSTFVLFAGADDAEKSVDKLIASVDSSTDPMKTTPEMVYVQTGESVTLNCVGPKDRNTQWRKNDDETWCSSHNCADTDGVLKISGASVEDSGTYECYLTHNHVAPFASITVYVADDDSVIVSPSEIVQMNESTPLNFSCKFKSEISDIPVWRLNGKLVADVDSRYLTYDNGTLYLGYPYGKNTGVYSCEISHTEDEGKAQKYYSFVKVTGPGYVYQKHESSQNLMQGDVATLKCEVYGFPTPSVVWTKEGNTEDMDDDRVSYEVYKGVQDGIMKISQLEFEDRANYTCNATNEFGSGEAHTFVRVKDKLAALWPFLGICAEVLVLVIIIFLYEKRRAKKEASDAEENADQKKALTEGGSDLRQRAVKA